jgi:hypothetical protein
MDSFQWVRTKKNPTEHVAQSGHYHYLIKCFFSHHDLAEKKSLPLCVLICTLHRHLSKNYWDLCSLICCTFCFLLINIFSVLIFIEGASWSYGSWIYNYICNQCLSPLKLWVRIPNLDITFCDKVCQWLASGLWFSLGTLDLVSSNNKTDRHDITEILLKVAFNTITLTLSPLFIEKLQLNLSRCLVMIQIDKKLMANKDEKCLVSSIDI